MKKQSLGTIKADDGTRFEVVVCSVDIDPREARRLFDLGKPTGEQGWKHKVWTVTTMFELLAVQKAARFFYGWDDGTEKITRLDSGRGFRYEALYTC